MRKCLIVLSEDCIHTNSRCEFVGGEESWNLKSSDKLAAITLSPDGAGEESLSFLYAIISAWWFYLYSGLIKLMLVLLTFIKLTF